MTAKYTVHARHASLPGATEWHSISSHASRGQAEAEIAANQRQCGSSGWSFKLESVAPPPAPVIRRAFRRDVKPGTLFRYATGWNEGQTYLLTPRDPSMGQIVPETEIHVTNHLVADAGEMVDVLWDPAVAKPSPWNGLHRSMYVEPVYKGFDYTNAAPPEKTLRLCKGSLRPELEELPAEEVERLAAEATAEAGRRKMVKAEAAASVERERRATWMRVHGKEGFEGFSNFMAGVTQALCCRSVLRWSKGHLPLGGKNPAGGDNWTLPEIFEAGRAFRNQTGYAPPWEQPAKGKSLHFVNLAKTRDKSGYIPF